MKRKSLVGAMFIIALAINPSFSAGQNHMSNERKRVSARPDLIPLLHYPMEGEIKVKNVGKASAGPTKLTLDCERLDSPDPMHSCPNLPLSVVGTYFDPMFPNHATIQIPALAPGQVFTHVISFWDVSTWPSGRYRFTAVADAAHTLSEADAKNNVATSLLIVP